MKRLMLLFLLVLLAASCSVPPGADEPEGDGNNGTSLTQSSSVFEGEWTWLETNGVEWGTGNRYRKDSISEGYSWKFKFYETNGQGGKLQTYKNDKAEILYLYQYTTANNSWQQKLTLDKMTNAAPEDLYWDILNKDEEVHLYLRNAAYFNDSCCDEKFEHHFVLFD